MNSTAPGFAHFLAQIDLVGSLLLYGLLTMSVISWTLIVLKGGSVLATRRRSRAFLDSFWNAPDLPSVEQQLAQESGPRDPFSRLTLDALTAVRQHRSPGPRRLVESGSAEEFLQRALRRSVDASVARMESGLSVLASIGSSAPFVGLLGTVWGIYNALLAIGVSGQGTLDKVAGPVGEALVMTAIGLAVAIPAVLAYNGFVRANRMTLESLDGFSHELAGFMATGQRQSEL